MVQGVALPRGVRGAAEAASYFPLPVPPAGRSQNEIPFFLMIKGYLSSSFSFSRLIFGEIDILIIKQ